MAMKMTGLFSLLVTVTAGLSGCMTGPHIIHNDDPWSDCEPGSPRWWAQKAQIPPGVKRRCKKGKVWPARPRPAGEGQQFSHTFHSAHYWPLPYVCQDRQYVEAINETQISGGWIEETTLYDRHFDPETQMLTRPGMLHLQRILDTTPPRRRAVYVQSTRDSAIDNARLSNVHTAVAELMHGPDEVPVTLRTGREYTRPASEVQTINSLYNRSIPAPRLTGGSSGGSASTGTSGASAASSAVP